MPFNPSGLLVRLFRWTDDRDAGTKILADRMDQEFDNAFGGINAILNGEQAFLGPVTVPYGTADNPGVQVDVGMGIYRKTEGSLGISTAGAEQVVVSSGGVTINGSSTAEGVTSTNGALTAMASSVDEAQVRFRDNANSPMGLLHALADRSALILRKYTSAGITQSMIQLGNGDVKMRFVGSVVADESLVNVARGDARFAAKAHTHDDRYFTEAESNTRFAYKSHTHSQYLPKSGGMMTGAVSMGGYNLNGAGRVEFSSGDHVDWETQQGMRFFENGTEVARIGPQPYVNDNFRIGGHKPMHSGRTLSQKGCVIFARSAAPSAKTYGDTVSGSNLTLSDHTGSTISTSIGGTWMCIGYCVPGNSTNFVRIA